MEVLHYKENLSQLTERQVPAEEEKQIGLGMRHNGEESGRRKEPRQISAIDDSGSP